MYTLFSLNLCSVYITGGGDADIGVKRIPRARCNVFKRLSKFTYPTSLLFKQYVMEFSLYI